MPALQLDSFQQPLLLKALEIHPGGLGDHVVAAGVRNDGVPRVRVLDRVLKQGELAVVELSRQRREGLLEPFRFGDLACEILLQIGDCSLHDTQLIDHKVGEVTVILLGVDEPGARARSREIGRNSASQ
jgi:hypothetical protein